MERFTGVLSQLRAKISNVGPNPNVTADYSSLRSSSDSNEKLLPASDMDGLRADLRRARSQSRAVTVTLASLLAAVFFAWVAREFTWRKAFNSTMFQNYPPDKITYTTTPIPDVFSPAAPAIQYKEVVFHNNFHADRTKWQGPPDDSVDAAWRDLYINVGVIKIPKSDADRLPNATLPIPGEEDGYITGLEVYHQLHCLDLVRKHLYPDRYGGDKYMSPEGKKEYWIHLEHCIDNLRQTIMCYSDISTIPWKWNERVGAEFPDAHTTHVCRDFDRLTEWMLEGERHFPQEEYQLRVEAFHKAGHL